ncbi:hypothetical protein PM082_021316 [Marasmius tenuissimus]|nr:hypothetical protein PM082_021316 [Marasmius tenuissimus]
MANSLLVPNLPMNRMKTLATALATAPESFVNGTWNGVLHSPKYFPQPDFIIQPEYRVEGVGDADLLVQRQSFASDAVSWTWRVVYEGKSQAGDSWEKINTQVIKYPRTALSAGQVCWCIGAKGRKVRFWRFKKGDSAETRSLQWVNGKIKIWPENNTVQPYDIVDDQTEIESLLLHFRNN